MNEIDRWAFKVLLIGPAAVGKTSLLMRFVQNKFKETYEYTMGVDYLSKEIEFGKNNRARLTIYDIGGQERFRFLRDTFYHGANGALIMFDLTRAHTFEDIKDWIFELRKLAGESIPFILIGNKRDLIAEVGRVIDTEEIHEFSEKEGCIYIETSAKTGENVERAFEELGLRMAHLIEPKKKKETQKKEKLPRNPIEAQGMLIKDFYKKFGEEALPIIRENMRKQGRALGLKAHKKLGTRSLKKVAPFFTKSWDPSKVKIIELTDRKFRIRGFGCPFGLENTSKDLCEAVMAIDHEYFKTAVNDKIRLKIISTVAADEDCCETIYELEEK